MHLKNQIIIFYLIQAEDGIRYFHVTGVQTCARPISFAELLRVPAAVVRSNLHRPPADLPDEVAAFLDPLASILHGWNRLGASPPETLLIYGAGAAGLLWAATARAHGTRAIVAGRGTPRLKAAKSYGARVVDVARGPAAGIAAEAAVDCTGDPRVWE